MNDNETVENSYNGDAGLKLNFIDRIILFDLKISLLTFFVNMKTINFIVLI